MKEIFAIVKEEITEEKYGSACASVLIEQLQQRVPDWYRGIINSYQDAIDDARSNEDRKKISELNQVKK